MEAAARLFRDKGYSATSMRDLAQAVHLQASSLYNHISSKQEILRDICFRNAQRYLTGIAAVEKAGGTPLAQVEALLDLHLDVVAEDVTSITAFNDEWRHLDPQALDEFVQLRKDYENRFRAILQSGIADGTFKAGDTNLLLFTILSSLRWVHDWYKPDRKPQLKQVRQTVHQLLLEGLKNSH